MSLHGTRPRREVGRPGNCSEQGVHGSQVATWGSLSSGVLQDEAGSEVCLRSIGIGEKG